MQRLERGDLEKDEDIFNINDGEARDDLSNLPIQFSVKVKLICIHFRTSFDNVYSLFI